MSDQDDEQDEHSKKKSDMLQALESTIGVVTPALKMAKVGRTTFYEWKKNDEKFKEAVEDINDIALDFSESRLFKLIKEDHPAAIFFHLKCKGKARGYIEKHEVDTNITSGGGMIIHLPSNGRDPGLEGKA